jgi:uncharacterized membrane protein YvbJ
MKPKKRKGSDSLIFCSECGQECAENAKFCSSCGNSLDSSSNSLRTNPIPNTNSVNATSNGSVYAILGWGFSGIAILFFPILFSGGGVIFGYLHSKENNTHGTIIIISAIACGLFGVVLGAGL